MKRQTVIVNHEGEIEAIKYCPKCSYTKNVDDFLWRSDKRHTGGGYYRSECKECYLRGSLERKNERYKNDKYYAKSVRLRGRLLNFLKGKAKYSKLVGCSRSTLLAYLEKGFYNHPTTGEKMTMENIDVDHKVPMSAFNLDCTLEQRACFHYTNLRPLWPEHNNAKGNKIDYIVPGLQDHLKERYHGKIRETT